MKKEIPNSLVLNYSGIFLNAFSLFIFVFVKTQPRRIAEKQKHKPSEQSNQTSKIIDGCTNENDLINYGSINNTTPIVRPQEASKEDDEANKGHGHDHGHGHHITIHDIYDKLGQRLKKPLGVTFALFSGVCSALSYVTILYAENNYENSSQNQIDYSFAFNTGIFMGSMLFFISYCIFMKNRPVIYPKSILPTFASGYFLIEILRDLGSKFFVIIVVFVLRHDFILVKSSMSAF